MPYSFTKIEEDKARTISFVFFFLVLFYFVSFWMMAAAVKYFIHADDFSSAPAAFSPLSWPESFLILGIALAVGLGHWLYTIINLIDKILGVLRAEPLNKNDTYHQMFQNIVDEVSVATGGRKMEGVVIPTMAMNAFALADFEGRAIIGVTEGVLARLTRAQIEAVVGHEAAHILKGDCLATTVTSSLFELYGGMLKGLEVMLRQGGRSRYSYGRGGGGGLALIFFIYLLLLITRAMSHLLRMFISRQREYRADAVAVRLTRDPLSLAEALYTIAYRWRGANLPAQELEAIFIINPSFSHTDEKEGFVADLFSTHPPVERRLQVLLGMAHMDMDSLIKEVESKQIRPRIPVSAATDIAASGPRWMVHQGGQWQGPFDLTTIAALEGLRPQTWIQRLGSGNVTMAYEDVDIRNIVHQKTGTAGLYDCPKCRIALRKISYEGVEAYTCPFCHGVLVAENDIARIIIRQEVGFTEKIVRIAGGIKREERFWREAKINRDPKTLLPCPKCRHKKARMLRMFYTEAYHVEIDKCFFCGLIWFDKDELEVLQFLIEDATHSKPDS